MPDRRLAAAQRDTLAPWVLRDGMQMGRHAAETIDRILHHETPTPFRYWDKGSLATIGRSAK